jgi:hypothetical protein
MNEKYTCKWCNSYVNHPKEWCPICFPKPTEEIKEHFDCSPVNPPYFGKIHD